MSPRHRAELRPYRDTDAEAVRRIGGVAAAWRGATVVRLVAGDPVVGHLYIVDRSTTAVRRTGVCDLLLMVAPEHRRRGGGSALYDRALRFAADQGASQIRAWVTGDEAVGFFVRRGWYETDREIPSRLDLAQFDPDRFQDLLDEMRKLGVRLTTYAAEGDSEANRRRLYELVMEVRRNSPWEAVPPDSLEPFSAWVEDLKRWAPETVVIAEADGEWVGVTTSPDWPYTGVAPRYRNRGIATALKAHQLALHQAAGGGPVETENHARNLPMLAVNRKLGYVFGPPSITLEVRL
jgi:GNAT superfamily N-acetyltransferase